MKNFLNRHLPPLKLWELLPLAILAFLFFYQFIKNFYLANWEILAITNVDDLAIQASVNSMQKALLTGNWGKIFGNFDYAYGNGFWLLNSILLLPFYFLPDEKFIIIIGREISLIFVFASIYLVGLIAKRLRPQEEIAKYVITILVAIMPIIASITCKLHVNPQAIFFGLLALYLLIDEKAVTKKELNLSAVFLGVAIGFKLTSILIAPIIGLVLLYRLHEQKNLHLKNITIYSTLTLLTAIFCAFPMLLAFPLFLGEVSNFFHSFQEFKDMNLISRADQSWSQIIRGTISPYLMNVWTFCLIAISSIMLLVSDYRSKKYLSSIIVLPLIPLILAVIFMVNKPAFWIDSYLISIIVLFPIGLLGIASLPTNSNIKNSILILILTLEIVCGYNFRRSEFANYYDLANSPQIQTKLKALDEMREIIHLDKPIKLLQDINAVFPYSSFDKEIAEMRSSFGDIKSMKDSGPFDFIVLNSKEFHHFGGDKPMASFTKYQSLKGLSGLELEAAMRQKLKNSGQFFDLKYQLIYDNYETEVYRRK
jgi:hypothetical protein